MSYKVFIRNYSGLTLPFALILTFIFSGLVAVSYLFVTINIKGLQSNLFALQAISIAEGINERIKARLNTKTLIQISPSQEEKLKTGEEDFTEDEEELAEEDEDFFEDEFDEETEDFDEYYADEILKISRYITFRDPPEPPQITEEGAEPTQSEPVNLRPEANVEMIGSIVIPSGTVLSKGIMIVVFKDEKVSLNLPDITPEKAQTFREKLPIPQVKLLSPNYSEADKRSNFIVVGENLNYTENVRFGNKDIVIEDIRGGPQVDFLIQKEVMPGLVKFWWESAQSEFYIIPTFDGSPRPVITDVKSQDGGQLLEVMAGQRGILLMIYGLDLFLKKNPSVVVPDSGGIIPKIKDFSQSGNELTISIDIDKKVDPGIHSLAVATEGGLSNVWVFNILPPSEEAEITTSTATFSSSLTLLDIRVVEDLLPIIDDSEDFEEPKKDKKTPKKGKAKEENLKEDEEDLEDESEEVPERQKLGPFANSDLETLWLLETSCMVGKITKTVSEVVHRQVPNINSSIITNGQVYLEGGSFKVIGATTAMAVLSEPTYLSNTLLKIDTEPKEETKTKEEPESEEEAPQISLADLGFQTGGLITVFKEGETIDNLDYAVTSKVEENIIELAPPGLMDFHYEGDTVFQFIPPVISKEKVTGTEAERHLAPKDFAISIPNYAMFSNIFKANIEQFSELSDLYTNDPIVPGDEFGIPLGFMGLSYIEGTPVFSDDNVLSGKGILIVDTRSDNLGKPSGDVELRGDSKNPSEFNGIVYVHGNLRIDGNVIINGALIVDNESSGQLQIASNAIGRITWSQGIIKQCILYVPFSTKPGTVMISNKLIDLSGYVESGKQPLPQLGAAPIVPGEETKAIETAKVPELPPEEALVETAEPILPAPGRKTAEEELIELF